MPTPKTDEAEIKSATMADIAASILNKPASPIEGKELPTEEGESDEEDTNTTEEEIEEEEVLEEAEEEGELAEEEKDEGEEGDEGDEDDAEDTNEEGESYLDVSDDDLIEVKVDGKVELRSLGDLKKAFSAEGAVQKRLQEATETRKDVDSMKTRSIENANRDTQVLVQAFQSVEQELATMIGQAPDKSLREKDPNKYFLEKEAYEDSVKDMETKRNKLRTLVTGVRTRFDESLNEYKQDQAQLLVKAIPDIADPIKGKPIMESILSVASHYGFTQDDIANVADHRLYIMAIDAAKYRKLIADKKIVRDVDVTDVSKEKRKTPRKLRSGATTLKNKATKNAAKANEARKQAQSGKTTDVAAFLRSPK